MARKVWCDGDSNPKLQAGFMNCSLTDANANCSIPDRCAICPLSRVQAGVRVRIKRLCATPELQHRLRELGLGEEQVIRLLTSQTSFICQVCNARLAISEKIARLILVEPVPARAAA